MVTDYIVFVVRSECGSRSDKSRLLAIIQLQFLNHMFAKQYSTTLSLEVFSCVLSILNFSYFALWFRGQKLGYDCDDSRSLIIMYFLNYEKVV